MSTRALKAAQQSGTTPDLKVVAGKVFANEQARKAVAELEVHAPTAHVSSEMKPVSEDLKTAQKTPQTDATIFASYKNAFCFV